MYPAKCPGCQADLRTPDGYNRVIGVVDQQYYDGVRWWKCPDCGYRWDRDTTPDVEPVEERE